MPAKIRELRYINLNGLQVPKPSAGAPVGYSNYSEAQGGALSVVTTGRIGREWRPTSGDSPLRCSRCGMLYKSEQDAAECCEAPLAVAERPPTLLTDDERAEIRRMTQAGHGPQAICKRMGLPALVRNAAEAVYQTERVKLMRAKGLDLRGWKAWQRAIAPKGTEEKA